MRTHILYTLALGALPLFSGVFASPIQDRLWERASSSVTDDLDAVKSKTFDYIVVGCGLAGLTVAGRLSEDTSKNVLCIEAGKDIRDDDRVVSLTAYGQAFNTDIDWAWKTTKQEINQQTKSIAGGKGLGGSTSINGGAWTRGGKEQYDALRDIGNDAAWGFDQFDTYMKKAEHFYTPSKWQTDLGVRYDESAHGTNGPVQTSFSAGFYKGPQQAAFISAVHDALGITQIDDLGTGVANGVVAYTPNTVQPNDTEQARVSAATAYLTPIENDRPNLVVLVGWRGTKATWSNTQVTGVTVQQSDDGPTTDLKAQKEVILASGAIRSPLFLEQSGIGDKDVLSSIGVEQHIDLPGVGRNLQEQTMDSIGAPAHSVDFDGKGPAASIAFPSISQLFKNATDVRSWVEKNADSWAQQAVDAGAVVNKEGLLAQYDILTKNIFDKNSSVMELFFDSGFPVDQGLGIDAWQLLPFSRGYVHATSSSSFSHPKLNPRYFTAPIDMDIQVAGLRGARQVLQASALAKLIDQGGETVPGFDASNGGIPDGHQHGRYSRWQQWILHGTDGSGGFSSVAHPIGTASMMPREKGGVVDSQLKVYGVEGLRVVDASVLPIQISAHLSSTLYGIAEKAADLIKN